MAKVRAYSSGIAKGVYNKAKDAVVSGGRDGKFGMECFKRKEKYPSGIKLSLIPEFH